MGYPQCAADAEYCKFNTVGKILAAISAGGCNGSKIGYWHLTHMNAKELGDFGRRLLKAHPIPKTTLEVMSRSTVLQGQLDALDDRQLSIVIGLIEQEPQVSVAEAKAFIKAFR
jgi:predicted metal-binding protein